MDLAEAESELTAGFFTEHSSTIFVFFFLAEYANILLLSTLTVFLFFGGYSLTTSLITFPFDILFNPLNFESTFIILNFLNGLFLGIKTALLVFLFI
jgi:NADH-ubiquinone oxidoreductase chain 1